MCDSCPVSGSSTTAPSSPARSARAPARRGRVPARRSREPARLEPRAAGRRDPEARAAPAGRRARSRRATRPGSRAARRRASRPRTPNETGLPGFTATPPEDLLDAELGLDRADEVVRADRDAARGDEHVVLEPALERLPVRVLVVGDRRQALDVSARRRELRREHQRRSPRRSRPARAARPAGAARCPLRARRRAAARRTRPRRRPRPRARRSAPARAASACERRPRPRRARRRRAAARSHPAQPRSAISTALSCSTTYSMRDDGIGTLGHDAAGRDPHRLARLRAAARAGRPAAIRERRPAASPACPPRAAANPSIAELGNGGRSTSARAASASTRPAAALERDRLRRQRRGALEHEAQGLLERQELGHDRRIPYARRIGSAAVISVVVPVHDEERSVALLYDELESALEPLGEPWEAVFVDDGSTDGTFAALTRLHAAQRQRPRRPPAPQLRQGGRARRRLRAGRGRRRRHDRRRPPGRPGRDPAAARQARRGLRPRLAAGRRSAATRSRAGVLSRIFNAVTGRVSGLRLHDMNCGLKAYRAEVVRGPARSTASCTASSRCSRTTAASAIAELPVNHRPREHGRSRYGVERYLRGFLDLLTVSFIGPLPAPAAAPLRRARPRCSARSASAILVYLTVAQAARATRSASGRC